MKKIILLLVIFIFALSGCAQNTKEKDVIDENVITNDENIIISGEIEEVEENEIVIESMDEYLERKNINKEDSEYDFDEIFAEYYDAEKEKELIDLIKNDPYMKNLKSIKIEIEFYEGMPCQVITAKHESTLGYTIKYRPETFKVKSENGKDIFYIEDAENIYVSIEKFETSYDDMINSLASYEVNEDGIVYTVKTEGLFVGDIETHNYVKTNDGFFVISYVYPNSTEFMEGLGTTIANMIETFELK